MTTFITRKSYLLLIKSVYYTQTALNWLLLTSLIKFGTFIAPRVVIWCCGDAFCWYEERMAVYASKLYSVFAFADAEMAGYAFTIESGGQNLSSFENCVVWIATTTCTTTTTAHGANWRIKRSEYFGHVRRHSLFQGALLFINLLKSFQISFFKSEDLITLFRILTVYFYF